MWQAMLLAFLNLWVNYRVEQVKGATVEVNISPTSKPTAKPTLKPSPSPTHRVVPTPTLKPIDSPTPTPTPTLLPPHSAPAWMEPLFTAATDKYKVDPNLLKKIADCESHFNTGVVSTNGLYAGMFQFAASSWISNRNVMGEDSNPDLRFGAKESIETAAFMISHGMMNSWPNCSK